MDRAVVTGAFGYTGRFIAARLLQRGVDVVTLTARRDAPPGLEDVVVRPLDFDDPAVLAEGMEGADVFFNTYWIRFERGELTFDEAVDNSKMLMEIAADRGVGRVVHVSITNPSLDSPYPYFRGKAQVEEALRGSRLGYAIVRPTVVFGPGDILVNNIAWMARRVPVFPVPGDGDYRVRPVHVDDVAALCVEAADRDDDVIVDAVGAEVYTFEEMVGAIAAAVGARPLMVHVPPEVALQFARLVSLAVGDVVLTRDELDGLMAELVMSDAPTTGSTELGGWLRDNAAALGRDYASELQRHYRRG